MSRSLPHRPPPPEHLQGQPRRPGLDPGFEMRGASTGADSTKPSSGKRNEKELMHGLNDRLAGFIEKVHQLEHHNRLLEREIQEIRGKAGAASCLEEEYGPELRKLRQMVHDISHQKHQIEIEHRNLEEELFDLRRRGEREARSRSDAESNIVALKKDISDAYQAKLQLDKKAQCLAEEIDFLKRNHEAEVSEMCGHIQEPQVAVKARDFGSPGITAALRDIRTQLEGYAVTDVQEAAETFRSQFARLTEAAESKREALKATQQEIQECRRRLQAKNIELDCAKGAGEALERQLRDFEDRHKEEIIHYQNTIKELENELINCKFDMSGYLREYQDLLNVKMALDVEILSYRKLLCGEEARLSTVSDTSMSLPYIYHQSPVYTLPCLTRPGGPHRRAEPQYKFVEEIITETTREIEMSEFEETGSEETEVGKDERERTKRDGQGSEEEEKDNKGSGEEENRQMSDSQQDQVASTGESVDGCDGGDGGSPGETEEAEAGDTEGESGVDKNAQSKVFLSESLDEQRGKGVENTKEEKDEDLSPKADDLRPEVNVEDEPTTDKEAAREVQVKKPADETLAKESDTTQECVGTEELSEKAPAASGTELKTEEKENTRAEQKETNRSEAAKGEEEVEKSTEDAQHDSNKSQDKDSSLGSRVKSCPGVSDPTPNSEDGTDMLPNENTTTGAGMKGKGPESSQELPEGPEENEPPSS